MRPSSNSSAAFAVNETAKEALEGSAFSACELHNIKSCGPIVELNTLAQALQGFAVHFSEDSDCILALQAGRRMHESMGEFAVVSQEQ